VLLSHVLHGFPDVLPDLRQLISDDEEKNFFLSVHHLQNYRRQRAIAQFAQLVREGNFKMPSLVSYIVPILHHTVVDATAKQHNLVDESLKAIAAVASLMEWGPYYRMFMNYLRLIADRPALEHQLVKLLCMLLDEFHFDVSKDFDALIGPYCWIIDCKKEYTHGGFF